jgi:hypothetical protein
MRVFPDNKPHKESSEPELTKVETVTRTIALLLALGSVVFFFFKILFF